MLQTNSIEFLNATCMNGTIPLALRNSMFFVALFRRSNYVFYKKKIINFHIPSGLD